MTKFTEEGTYTSRADIDTTCLATAFLFGQLRSKDPNTKVGACVYDPNTGGLFLGYNGFPAGIPDLKSWWDNRDSADPGCKYNRVVHAEANAVRKAMVAIGNLRDCTLYVTHYPCHRCMKDFIIPSKLHEVVYLHKGAHYDEVSADMAHRAEVRMNQYADPEGLALKMRSSCFTPVVPK